jgi:uncharacterized protein (DUF433 family)
LGFLRRNALSEYVTALASQDFSEAGDSMITSTDHPYIIRNDEILSGEPIIKGTRTPVRAIVELWQLGYHPDEIPMHLPHLSLAAVFDALSYYSDHQSEINEYIVRNRVPEKLVDPRSKKR